MPAKKKRNRPKKKAKKQPSQKSKPQPPKIHHLKPLSRASKRKSSFSQTGLMVMLGGVGAAAGVAVYVLAFPSVGLKMLFLSPIGILGGAYIGTGACLGMLSAVVISLNRNL